MLCASCSLQKSSAQVAPRNVALSMQASLASCSVEVSPRAPRGRTFRDGNETEHPHMSLSEWIAKKVPKLVSLPL